MMKICSICQQPYTEYGNSAHPINDGRCCDYCDCMVVTTTRMSMSHNKPRESFIEFAASVLKEIKQRKEAYPFATGMEPPPVGKETY